MLAEPLREGFTGTVWEQVDDFPPLKIFLRVFVKRQFSLPGLASEGCWCLSVLNSHVIRCGQALCFWLTLRSIFLFLQG